MTLVILEILVIAVLLLLNGLLAMTELAVVSARKVRLQGLAERGDARARAALELAASPNRFLPTVQVGITLVGVMAGAFGGATLAEHLAEGIRKISFLAPYAQSLGLGLVVVTLTYFSLVLGELLPKRIALTQPERIACLMARPMQALARLARPAVDVLGGSSDGLMRLLGIRETPHAPVTEEEVRVLMEEGRRAGIFHHAEPQIVARVMHLDRLRLSDLMTPRTRIFWLNLQDTPEQIWHKVVVSGHSVFPVYERSRDQVAGIVTVKDLYAQIGAGVPLRLKDLLTLPLYAPFSQRATTLLETFRKTGQHMALVTDEYGGIAGLVTLHDLMEAVLGDFPSAQERSKPRAVRRTDGSWLVDGMLNVVDLQPCLPGLLGEEAPDRDCRTVGGWVMKRLGRVPAEGDTFVAGDYRVEVLDMDGHRVDKLLFTPVAAPPEKS
ncbi:hemolysin family protein [Fontisphaera persica]|uniref:hemolysin family protein n=1 Tax=Fontisphaera persica TaxID=2974023 RepID=UPI0024BF2F52|nr:hemolysin family protein [Fontisphaera persica]WCJ58318.1 hemolysin family protein [Fontisphaera persica]